MKIYNIIVVVIFIFFIGNLIFVSRHKHLLIILLSLEFIVLRIFLFIILILSYIDYNIYILIVFLVFAVCEGALGLSILVSMIRTHGNDYFQRFNLL
jgi:NADH-ubiquinone oxidoreductase chain 4L